MTPWTLRLIVANIAMYFVGELSPVIRNQMVLIPAEILKYPWTPITYMFLHGSGTHILFNMISLFFFGPRVESRLGGRHFLLLYFISGISGALLSLLSPNVPIVGASGAIFGVMFAFARYWPRDPIYIWGILPIEARWLILIMTVMNLLPALSAIGSRDGIAHFAHLGGFLGGYLYLRWLEVRSPARGFRARATAQPPKPRISNQSADLQRWSKIPRDRMHEVNRAEVDRILDKISAKGIASLTPGEREVLDRFSTQH
jgi:membrane associated rhomboid family serine protease